MDNVVVVQYKMTPASQERSTTSRVSPAKFVPVALLLKLKLQFCIHIPHTKAVRMTQATSIRIWVLFKLEQGKVTSF